MLPGAADADELPARMKIMKMTTSSPLESTLMMALMNLLTSPRAVSCESWIIAGSSSASTPKRSSGNRSVVFSTSSLKCSS